MSGDNWMIVINKDMQDPLTRRLLACGLCVMISPDIYDLPPDNHVGSAINEYDGDVVVCSDMTDRAARWSLHSIGVTKKVSLLQTDGLDDDRIVECICQITGHSESTDNGILRDFSQHSHSRWYPVIDFERCTNCHSCVEFCLFGVYELDSKGDVFVAIADNCKTGCPSCARVCPANAIMFPRYPGGGPIAGGEGEIEVLDPQQARTAGGEDVKLFREKGGKSDGDDQINSAIDDLESFDA